MWFCATHDSLKFSFISQESPTQEFSSIDERFMAFLADIPLKVLDAQHQAEGVLHEAMGLRLVAYLVRGP